MAEPELGAPLRAPKDGWNNLQFERMEKPDWEQWKAMCKAKRIEPPSELIRIFHPIVRARFTTITERGWRAKFGLGENVFETMWRRYFYQFFFYDLQPLEILLYFNHMATNQCWDEIGTNWNSSRTTVFRKAKFAQSVLSSVLDEVRAFNGASLLLLFAQL